jgi:aminopeptidase YwaD
MRFSGKPLAVLCVLASLFLVACGGDSDSDPTSTPGSSITGVASPSAEATTSPSATPSPGTTAVPGRTSVPPGTGAPLAAPDGARILDRVRYLTETIGPRPAGSSGEQAAIDYITAQLESFGYTVEVREFSIATQSSREAMLTIASPEQRTIASLPLSLSSAGFASGQLVAAGIGRPGDFPAAVAGNIALIERGELTFGEKARNAADAGAVAVVIYNNEPGHFLGDLDSESDLPVVSITKEAGEDLVALLGAGAVMAEVSVGELSTGTSRNIVALPPSGVCDTITGGHYDTVPPSPGANDNGSGTATVIEIAGVIAGNDAMANNCFVLFGAEENGLLGSRAYVAAMTDAERQRLKFMLNFDMFGFGEEELLVLGSSELQDDAAAIAAELGIDVSLSGGPGSVAGSDHASFISAGFPVLFFNRWPDPQWHQPGDIVSGRIDAGVLESAALIGVGMLELANGG